MARRRALLAAAPALALPAAARARELADATGRRVPVPSRVARVFPAGPPAAILAYTLAPDLLAGWPERPPRPHEAAFMDPAAAALPGIARLTGRDATATPDVVLAQRPDIVLDYGSVAPAFTQLAERVQAQTGIPTLLLDGALGKIPETYLQLGDMLDRPREAAERAGIADIILLSARQAAARLGARGRPRVFQARGPHGTRTGLRGSMATEILELAGAENVAVGPPGARGLAPVSPEQVLAWDPDWIVALDPAFLRHAQADPMWRAARAVRQGRLVLAPGAPFGWVDTPPAVNRLLGLMWLPVLFGVAPADVLPDRVEAFHQTFYHRRPTAGQVRELLADAFPRG
jgi:iron complex transport system substrate-binding protein